jgi:hypothetical protein
VPLTRSPDFVTLYVTVVPLQKWKVSVTRAPSSTSAKKAAGSVITLPLSVLPSRSRWKIVPFGFRVSVRPAAR